MRSMTRLVFAGLATMASASIAGAQQSVRAPNDTAVPKLTKAQLQELREEWAMKCLTGQALATVFMSSGRLAPEESKIKFAGGNALGLSGLDASQGLVRGQHAPMFAGGGHGGRIRSAMAARYETNRGAGLPCEPPLLKFPKKQ